ncbi:MAG: hypothetical protein GXY48_02580 [Methanomicrobiales archaeon]|nr:hypothetical protein [Methanomicrobiales archaeon]
MEENSVFKGGGIIKGRVLTESGTAKNSQISPYLSAALAFRFSVIIILRMNMVTEHTHIHYYPITKTAYKL